MNLISAFGAVEIGLIFALVALGVLISFRVLNFPDMTADGSFPLGGAVAATLIVNGWNPFVATILAMFSGAATGWLTAYLNVKMKIMQLLAGILVMIALYSVNLRVMGKPNVAMINVTTVFDLLRIGDWPTYVSQPAVLLAVVVIVKLLVDWFFVTEIGLGMRSTGINPRMARAQGISTDWQTLLGLSMSNGLIALAGALFAQTQGGADISMGIGTIVAGLAAVIIGETMFNARSFFVITLACIVGAVLYRFLIALALNTDFIGLQAQDLNLVTALLVAGALLMPRYRHKIRSMLGLSRHASTLPHWKNWKK